MGVKGKTVVAWGDETGFCHRHPNFYQFAANKKIAFDISCLLYRCAMRNVDEALGTPPVFVSTVNGIRKIIQRLQFAKCTPVIVFDGAVPPGKTTENERRHGKRAEILERLHNGEPVTNEEKIKAVNIHHPALRILLFELMRQLGVQYFVAANEADCELASLDRSGRVDAIVTRDGDFCILYAQIVVGSKQSTGMELVNSNLLHCPCFSNKWGKISSNQNLISTVLCNGSRPVHRNKSTCA